MRGAAMNRSAMLEGNSTARSNKHSVEHEQLNVRCDMIFILVRGVARRPCRPSAADQQFLIWLLHYDAASWEVLFKSTLHNNRSDKVFDMRERAGVRVQGRSGDS